MLQVNFYRVVFVVPSITILFMTIYIIIKFFIPTNEEETDRKSMKIAERFGSGFFVFLQCILGMLIHPAFCIFTVIVFLPIFGMKFNFFTMKNKDRLRQTVFIAAYCYVVYALTHFSHKPNLLKTNKTAISKLWLVIGELYLDAQCPGNLLLFFIWTLWIPNIIIILWFRPITYISELISRKQ